MNATTKRKTLIIGWYGDDVENLITTNSRFTGNRNQRCANLLRA